MSSEPTPDFTAYGRIQSSPAAGVCLWPLPAGSPVSPSPSEKQWVGGVPQCSAVGLRDRSCQRPGTGFQTVQEEVPRQEVVGAGEALEPDAESEEVEGESRGVLAIKCEGVTSAGGDKQR